MAEPVWVRDDVVLAIHQRQLAEHGGGAGIRNEGLLASAPARPRNLLAYAGEEADLPSLAAAYAYGTLIEKSSALPFRPPGAILDSAAAPARPNDWPTALMPRCSHCRLAGRPTRRHLRNQG